MEFNYLKLFFCLLLSGCLLLGVNKVLNFYFPVYSPNNYEVDIFRLSDKNMARQSFSKRLILLNEQRKEMELCQFWTVEYLKEQNRVTKDNMDIYCK